MTAIKKVPGSLSNMRLDKVSAEIFEDFSRTQLKKWIIEGRILLNGDISSPKEIVQENDEIEINPISEEKVSWEPEDIHFDVIHETEHYLIIDKHPGIVMHPGAGCKNGTLANGLVYQYPELKNLPRCGIVHRLDKDTSGILAVAKTEGFRNYFVSLLQERKIKKSYKAIVVGNVIGSFRINDPIGRDKNNRLKMAIRSDGKESESFIQKEKDYDNYSLLNVSILTGRTHQIRVHLANYQLPIIGDKTYNPAGRIAKNTSSELIEIIRNFPRQALHSFQLSFFDPYLNNDVSFFSDMHKDMLKLLDEIKKYTK